MPNTNHHEHSDGNQGPHVALEPGAIRAAECVIHSLTEFGIHDGNEIVPELMPTAALERIARAVITEAENGTRSWEKFVPLFTANEADRIAFVQCAQGSYPAKPPHCQPFLETLRTFHRVRETWRIGLALQAAESDGQRRELTKALLALEEETSGLGNRLTFTHADDLTDTEGAFDFVEDLLTDGAASVVYGASNSGKTFLVLDLAAHVATGKEWQEKEVEQGAVLYIALEGRQGAKNRIKAMRLRGILPAGHPFFLCFSPVNLLDLTHAAAVSRMIDKISEKSQLPVRLVIVDTLARAMAGGDENSGQDMGRAVETIDAIRAKTAAHVCIIHHCGKDAAKGARGHSSLRAAIDTEIEIIHPEGDKYRTATIVKQRDLPTISPLCFSLDLVEVGRSRRGKPITSCVVKTEDSIMAHTKGKAGAKKKFTCEMILELLPQPSVKEWGEAAKKAHGMSADTFGDRKRECASRWENVGNQITVKPLQGKGEWGNGEIQF